MKILLLTDIHSGSDTNYPHRNGPHYINSFGGTLESSITIFRKIAGDIDLVINLGDFIHEASLSEDLEQYKRSKDILESLGKPVLHVSGNHDLVYMDRNTLGEIWGTDKLYYYRDFGGFRHIVLDGNRDRNINGIVENGQKYRFDSNQIDWLRQVLLQGTLPCVIYSHFPIDEQKM